MVVSPHRREKSPVGRKLHYGDGTPMKPLQHYNSAHVLHIPDDDLVGDQCVQNDFVNDSFGDQVLQRERC